MFVSCIQTNPQEDIEKNTEDIFSLVELAANNGADVVVLPEMFSYMGEERFRIKARNKLNEGIFLKLKSISKSLGITLVAGSHCEEIHDNKNKVYNTSVTLNKYGEIISHYRKLHLFNLWDKDKNPIYLESQYFEVGQKPLSYVINTEKEIWKSLNIICYDLRFPEIIRNESGKKNQPCDVLFVLAAFTWQTGKDHWEILLRARAIENQCYVVACNQTGFFCSGKKRNYGNSMIVDPWGQVIARLNEECSIISAEIKKNFITEVREKLPALSDRKIY
jgi:nitrilase